MSKKYSKTKTNSAHIFYQYTQSPLDLLFASRVFDNFEIKMLTKFTSKVGVSESYQNSQEMFKN